MDAAGAAARLAANPYYPVDEREYPGLLEMEITPAGRAYLGRLEDGWPAGRVSGAGCRHLAVLMHAEAAGAGSAAGVRRWQAYAFLAGEEGAEDDAAVAGDLARMGCMAPNPRHDPSLMRRHLAWARAAGRRKRI